ncbi:hypothetical protein DVK02_10725 [Halobellus sp. Atlit-31R]|nr:hypothetical protein DVK02_10725 [Halobellus sp. Atlit-31R]
MRRRVIILSALLVLAVALVPASAAAAGALNGTVEASGGSLVVGVENGTEPFAGDKEAVNVTVAGTHVETTATEPSEGTYTYEVDADTLAATGSLATGGLSNATVEVRHESGANLTETVDLRYARFGSEPGAFTERGTLRVDFAVAVGLPDGTSVPVSVVAGDVTENATLPVQRDGEANASYLELERATLTALGLFEEPREVTVRARQGATAYVGNSATADVDGLARTAMRAERDVGGIALANPLFVADRTYVVEIRRAGSEERYLASVTANETDGWSELRVESTALLSVDKVDFAVERDGTELVSGTANVASRNETATRRGDGTAVDVGALAGDERSVRAVWVEGDAGVRRYGADLNASSGTLSLAGGQAIPTSATALLVEFENDESVYATFLQTGSEGGSGAAADGTGSGSGLLDALPGGPLLLGGIAAVALLVLVVILVGVRQSRSGPAGGSVGLPFVGGGSRPNTDKKAPPRETLTVTFDVVDEKAGGEYRGADRILARPIEEGPQRSTKGVNTTSDDRERKRIALSGAGEDDAHEFELGAWRFEVIENDQPVGGREYRLNPGADKEHISLSVPPHEMDVLVTGGVGNEPLGGAAVAVRSDVGTRSRQPTDPKGRAKFQIPRSASTVAVTADYEELPEIQTKVPVKQAVHDGVRLEIAPEMGSLEIETKVGARHWPGVDVDVTPISEEAKAYTDAGAVTTDEDGRRRVTDLPAGEYELVAKPRMEDVETTGGVATATVEGDRTTDATLSIEMSFSLSGEQRERIAELRDEIDDLTAASNRDVAVPHYYGTVLESVLGMVEELESNPERAVEDRLRPGRVVDALLRATGEGVDVVEGAMSERRNIKLFRACESMAPVEESWGGDTDLDAFFERVEEGDKNQRRVLRNRLRETDELLDRKWSEVGEIGPARKVHDRVVDQAQRSGNVDDELAVVAQAYVSICLLDAVESLFDHEALRDRLNSGGY